MTSGASRATANPQVAPAVEMRVLLHRSPLDARRGVVRLHPVALSMLGVQLWEPLQLRGDRTTGALAAAGPADMEQNVVYADDLICANAGVQPGATVLVSRAQVAPASAVVLSGTPEGSVPPDPFALRFALLGKVLSAADRVSLLPQDFTLPSSPATDASLQSAIAALTAAFGHSWRSIVFKVVSTAPSGLVGVTMETEVSWEGQGTTGSSTPIPAEAETAPLPEDLPGLEDQIDRLRELLDLGFHHDELLGRLGTQAQMGVLITGPPGSGKGAMVQAVAGAVGARLFRLWGPALARTEPQGAGLQLRAGLSQAEAATPAIVLIEDVDAAAPREDPGPLLSLLVEEIQGAVGRGKIAVVCTTAHPESTAAELRRPGVLDHEIEIPMPQRDERRRILEIHTRSLPLAPDVHLDDIATRTPGFVAADLMALAREAALRAAQRAASSPGSAPFVGGSDFNSALEVVRPSSLGGVSVEIADVSLDDVGDMEETKKEMTELVIWPLRYPDTFERLGVDPPSGVLLFGAPGCGKTFLMKALANEAQANFLSVKGAELLNKWVGESERGVRELFRRARGAAPALIFFDEIDALAPARGRSEDAGATDRVVAQMLTEMDGIEELHGVFCVGATNRPDLVDPALLRPGRLERLVYVPPPGPEARSAILKASARRMPLADDVDLDSLGRSCDGYSGADLDALARRAAMNAMRESVEAPVVTAAHFEAAGSAIRPSLRADQVASLEAFAQRAGSDRP